MRKIFYAKCPTKKPIKSNLPLFLFLIFGIIFFSDLNAEEMDINQCVSYAIRESEVIKSQQMAVEAADYDKKDVAGMFFPQAKVSYNYMELGYHGEPEAMMLPFDTPLPFKIPLPGKQHNIEFSAVQPLTLLWAINEGHSIKKLSAQIERNKLQLNTNQLKSQVSQYYYTYFMLEENISLLNQTIKFLNKYREIASSFISEGMSDKRSVLKIDIEIAKTEKELKNVEGMQSVIKTAISMYINRDETSFSLKQIDKTNIRLTADYKDLIDIQRKTRPEIKMLENSQKIHEKIYSGSFAEFVPNVALVAGYKNDFAATSMSPEGSAYIGGVAEWEFGSQLFSKYSRTKKAKAELVKVKLDKIAKNKNMQLQIKSLLSDINVKQSEMLISQKEVTEAKENLRIEESKYKEKYSTETDLLNALLLMKKADTAKVNSYYNYRILLTELSGTIGVNINEITEISNR